MKQIETRLGQFEIHDDFIIARFNEGLDINRKDVPAIVSLLQDHMGGDFGFISDKINSYSVNPFIATEVCESIKNLKCYCNVTYQQEIRDIIPIAKNTFPKHLKLHNFDTVPEAIAWVQDNI